LVLTTYQILANYVFTYTCFPMINYVRFFLSSKSNMNNWC